MPRRSRLLALLRGRAPCSTHRSEVAVMDSYEFACFGRDLDRLEATIASWCSRRRCRLETTELPDGAAFRISGPDEAIREAIQMVRVWMLRGNR